MPGKNGGGFFFSGGAASLGGDTWRDASEMEARCLDVSDGVRFVPAPKVWGFVVEGVVVFGQVAPNCGCTC